MNQKPAEHAAPPNSTRRCRTRPYQSSRPWSHVCSQPPQDHPTQRHQRAPHHRHSAPRSQTPTHRLRRLRRPVNQGSMGHPMKLWPTGISPGPVCTALRSSQAPQPMRVPQHHKLEEHLPTAMIYER